MPDHLLSDLDPETLLLIASSLGNEMNRLGKLLFLMMPDRHCEILAIAQSCSFFAPCLTPLIDLRECGQPAVLSYPFSVDWASIWDF